MKHIQVLNETYPGLKRNLSRFKTKPIQVLKESYPDLNETYPGFKGSLSRF